MIYEILEQNYKIRKKRLLRNIAKKNEKGQTNLQKGQ